jgi:hypothetical protein
MTNHDLVLFENGGMDELASLETHDAALRYSEGSLPPGYAQHQQTMSDIESPSWYKNPTFLTVVGAGAVALLLVCAMSRKKD